MISCPKAIPMCSPFVRCAVMLAACATLGAALPARAQSLLFTDRALFQAATASLNSIDFNDQVELPATFVNYFGNQVTVSGVTFSADQGLFAVNPAFSSDYGLGNGTALSWQREDTLPSVLSVALPRGINAVGVNFGAFESVPFTFTLSTGETFVLGSSTTPIDTPTFAGFVSAAPLIGLTITATDFAPQIDRFEFGSGPSIPSVPEPSRLALFLVGVLLLSVRVSRRSKERPCAKSPLPLERAPGS